jgi:hypothetical protein
MEETGAYSSIADLAVIKIKENNGNLCQDVCTYTRKSRAPSSRMVTM